MKSDIDSRRFFACYSEYQKLLEIDNPERLAFFIQGNYPKNLEASQTDS